MRSFGFIGYENPTKFQRAFAIHCKRETALANIKTPEVQKLA